MGIGDGGGLRILCQQRGVVVGIDIGTVVAGRSEIDRCGEGGVRNRLRVLCMGPFDGEVLVLIVSWHVLFAVNVVAVIDAEIAVELIAFDVFGLASQSPCSFGVDIACDGEIDIVVDGEIVATIREVESASHLVAVGWDDDTGGIGLGEGEESEWYGNGERNIHEYHIGGSACHPFVLFDFRFGQVEVIVWVFVVGAGGIVSVAHQEDVVIHLLGLLTDDVSVTLLEQGLSDESFFVS